MADSTQQQDSGAALAAVADVNVEQLPEIMAVDARVASLAQQAERLDVHNDVTAEAAARLLSEVVTARKNAEEQRLSLVRPLRQVMERINASAKQHMAPLQAIEQTLKGKVGAYQAEQRRKAEEERRRLEEEARAEREREEEQRRKEAEAARQEAERVAREAEQARQEAERAERARREREAHEMGELERQVAQLTDEELNALCNDPEAGPARRTIARRQRQERRDAQAAKDAAAAAAQRAEEARQREQEVRQRELIPMEAPEVRTPGPVRGGGASVSTGQRWDYELEDLVKLARAVGAGEVPPEVLQLNRGEVRRMVNAGTRRLAGVRIFQKDVSSVRTGR